MQDEEKGEAAKMDLALWMQEDGTGIFGSLIFATDIFDAATMQSMAKHFVVRTSLLRVGKLPTISGESGSGFTCTRTLQWCAQQPHSGGLRSCS